MVHPPKGSSGAGLPLHNTCPCARRGRMNHVAMTRPCPAPAARARDAFCPFHGPFAEFLGAIDSVASCAMLLDIAANITRNASLAVSAQDPPDLKFVFFDGVWLGLQRACQGTPSNGLEEGLVPSRPLPLSHPASPPLPHPLPSDPAPPTACGGDQLG